MTITNFHHNVSSSESIAVPGYTTTGGDLGNLGTTTASELDSVETMSNSPLATSEYPGDVSDTSIRLPDDGFEHIHFMDELIRYLESVNPKDMVSKNYLRNTCFFVHKQ